MADIKNPASYYPLSSAEIALLLGKSGYCVGAFNAGQELIAFAAAYFPGAQADNLGLDLGFTGPQLGQAAHLEAGIVHPLFRGHHLQKRLYRELLEAIAKSGSYRFILSTVAPDNYPALINSLNLSLCICKLQLKYNHLLRYVLIHDLKEPVNILPDTIIKCRLADLETQRILLNHGYYGFDITNDGDEPTLYLGVRYELEEQVK